MNDLAAAAATTKILAMLAEIQKSVGPQPPARIVLTLKGSLDMGAYLLPDDGSPAYASASFVDAAGQPATDANPLTWSSSDPTVLIVTPSADGSYTTVMAVQPPKLATAQIQVTDGTLTATADVQVVAGPVASISIGLSASAPSS